MRSMSCLSNSCHNNKEIPSIHKIDIRDWNASHDRMSRGITLTEDQAMKMTKGLLERFSARSAQEHSAPMKDGYVR